MSSNSGIDRRQFLTGSAGALLFAMLGAEELRAQAPAPKAGPGQKAPDGPPIGCAVIGLGIQGRSLLQSLASNPSAPVLAVCDNYTGAHARALKIAPQAAAIADYRRVLDNKDVQAVLIATPSHLHRQIAVDAIAAGKHVYCEAPIAHTIEDAKAIALAARGSKKVFQAGLVHRADPISAQVRKFVDAGAMGKLVQSRAQFHKRTSWRRAAGTPQRERDLNWRLVNATSPGLVGEQTIHQMDLANWYVGAPPVAVSGFGAIVGWPDGREVADTIQCVVEYPENIHMLCDATLANSFEGDYELFQGTESAILIREGRAWMVKEADSTALGWEVYARKEKFGYETGIALVADATKQLELGKKPGEQPVAGSVSEQGMVDNMVAAFLKTIRDPEAEPVAGPEVAYQAAVVALKANEAVKTGTRIALPKELFALA